MIKILVSDSNGEPLNGVTLTVVLSTKNTIQLNMEPLDKFNNAVGPITVAYSGGTLMGEGGPVESFEETFLPTDLIAKPNQNPAEHIDLTDIKVTAVRTKIDFLTIGHPEHIDLVDIKITANLIHIDDI